MATELEYKAHVPSHSPIRRRLRQLKAKFIRRVLETNIHFDTRHQTLLSRGSGLRIRMFRDLSSRRKKMPPTITFKGPLRKGPYKSREEIETTIGDYQEMVDLLEPLGLHERIRFEKRRESWSLPVGRPPQTCKVELDQVPVLGSFVEIEGPNVRAIRAALKLLGLGQTKPIREGYVGLLAATRKRDTSGRRKIFKF
jgi:adenylate cyclase class 2